MNVLVQIRVQLLIFLIFSDIIFSDIFILVGCRNDGNDGNIVYIKQHKIEEIFNTYSTCDDASNVYKILIKRISSDENKLIDISDII